MSRFEFQQVRHRRHDLIVAVPWSRAHCRVCDSAFVGSHVFIVYPELNYFHHTGADRSRVLETDDARSTGHNTKRSGVVTQRRSVETIPWWLHARSSQRSTAESSKPC